MYYIHKNATDICFTKKGRYDTVETFWSTAYTNFCLAFIGTSYLPKFQKRAVTNLKNYSTKKDENLRKPKEGQ